ncbi:MAG: UTRA domain-containing protein [Alphaproteobacteria bacterium]|nr:UTRA domain-containing protein [Alphaproteobacteria bacterium]
MAPHASAARRPKPELTPELIDDASPTPLYHQIYSVLRERIRTGHYPAGSLLPGEQELVKLLGVSRITVKRALSELAAGGFVTRHRGRGTTVTFDAAAPVVKGSFENLVDSLRLMGLGTEVELLEVATVRAPADIVDLLGLEAGARVQRAVRLRKIEAKPFSYLITHVPGDIAARFPARDLAHKPMLEMIARAGHEAVEAEQWITAAAADLKVARALGIASGAPLLEIRRVMRDREGRGVEALHGFYRPDRFQHHMKLARRRRGGRTEWL